MDRDQIAERRKQAESSFSALEEEKQSIQKRLDEIGVEQMRLQGEHRAYTQLLEEKNDSMPVSPVANVIDATEAEEQA